jgi:glutaminase
MDLQKIIEYVHKKYKRRTLGKNADYIPELKKIDPQAYAISICTIDGTVYNVGDSNDEFTIQSVSKIFSLALALKTVGIAGVKKLIGAEQTAEKFNSIGAIEDSKNHTINSFENGGAIATTSIMYEKNKAKFEKKIFDNMSKFAGRELHYSRKLYHSEIANADRNRAIAYLLKSYDRFYGDVEDTLDVYTKQCAALVTSKDIALMAATLANDGINPKTHKRVVEKKYIPYILKHMSESGMYEYSETWMTQVGIHAKSGVGGAILMVVPGVMGIGIISPPLDEHGNSAKGILTAKELSKHLKLGAYRS